MFNVPFSTDPAEVFLSPRRVIMARDALRMPQHVLASRAGVPLSDLRALELRSGVLDVRSMAGLRYVLLQSGVAFPVGDYPGAVLIGPSAATLDEFASFTQPQRTTEIEALSRQLADSKRLPWDMRGPHGR